MEIHVNIEMSNDLYIIHLYEKTRWEIEMEMLRKKSDKESETDMKKLIDIGTY